MRFLFKYYLPALLSLSVGISNAQNWIWANHTVKGNGNNYALDVSVDTQNNCFITGRVKSTATIGTGTNGTVVTPYGDRDIYVAKYGDDSTFKWATYMGGVFSDYGYGLDNDSQGNTYVTGHFTSSATFQSYTLSSYGSSDFFITKLDSSGNVIWVTQEGGTSADGAYGIKTLGSGTSYVVGSFLGTAVFGNDTLVSNGLDDIFVSKFDSTGMCLWAVSFGGADNDVGFGIDADENGNIYFTGYFTATVSFGSYTLSSTSAGNADIVTAKMDDSGNIIWAVKAGSGVADQGNNLVTDNIGNVYVVGNWAQTTITVLKYDSSGNLLWQIYQGGSGYDTGNGIGIDNDHNVFVTGYFSSTVNFSGIPLTASGGDDIFIEKFDSSGVIMWARKQGGNLNDHSFGLELNNKNEILIAGAFEGTADFDGTSFTSIAVFDAFLGKLGQPIGAYFSADDISVCIGNSVSFTSTSTGSPTSYQWSFPGGNPTSSISDNPVIIYPLAGSFDVTLIVSDGTTSDTLVMTNYITVQTPPSVNLGSDYVICDTSSTTLDAGVGFVSYLWSDSSTAQQLTVSAAGDYWVTVFDDFCSATDTISISVEVCNGLEELFSEEFLQIFPNPADLIIRVSTNFNYFDFSLVNACGSSMIDQNCLSSAVEIDLSDIPAGIYFLKVNNGNTVITKKIIVVKQP